MKFCVILGFDVSPGFRDNSKNFGLALDPSSGLVSRCLGCFGTLYPPSSTSTWNIMDLLDSKHYSLALWGRVQKRQEKAHSWLRFWHCHVCFLFYWSPSIPLGTQCCKLQSCRIACLQETIYTLFILILNHLFVEETCLK